jgi:hypothetical protein
MSAHNVLIEVAAFVDQARVADDRNKIASCVNDGLARIQTFSMPENDAIHMMTTAIVSFFMQNKADSDNLFQVFIELEQRRKTP